MTPEQRAGIEARLDEAFKEPVSNYQGVLTAAWLRFIDCGPYDMRLLLAEIDRQAAELDRLRGVEQAARALVDCLPDSRREMDEVVRLRRDYLRQALEGGG